MPCQVSLLRLAKYRSFMELWPRLLLKFLLEVWSKFPSFLSTPWPNLLARNEREELQNFNLVPCLNPWEIYPKILLQSIESFNKEEVNLWWDFWRKKSSWFHISLEFEVFCYWISLFFNYFDVYPMYVVIEVKGSMFVAISWLC